MVDPIPTQPGGTQFGKPTTIQEGSPTREPSLSSPTGKPVPTAEGITAQNVSEILTQMGLEVTPENERVVAALIARGLPLEQSQIQMLASLQGNVELGALLISLGIEPSGDILTQVLDLGDASTHSGQILKELLELLGEILATEALELGTVKTVEDLIAQIRQVLVSPDLLTSDPQIKEWLAQILSGAGVAAIQGASLMPSSPNALLLLLSDSLGNLSLLLGEQLQTGDVKSALLKRLSEIRNRVSHAALGQILLRSFHESAFIRNSSLLFFPLLWHDEPGTLSIAFEQEQGDAKDSGRGERGATSFLLTFESLGRILGRVAVDRSNMNCDLGVELEQTQKMIFGNRRDLFKACDNAGLTLKRFECFVVASEQCEAFFSPFALHPDLGETSPGAVSRIDLLA